MATDNYENQYTALGNNEDGLQKICNSIKEKFQVAMTHKDAEGVTCRLRQAWYAQKSQYLPEFADTLAKASSADVYFGLFAMQRATAIAQHTNLMSQVKDKPWTLEPTPNPSVMKDIRDGIIQSVVSDVINGSLPSGDTISGAKTEIARQAELTQRKIYQKSAAIAEKHSTLIKDQMLEGGLLTAFPEFVQDIFTYPNAFFIAPEAVEKTVLTYKKNSVVEAEKIVYEIRTVSPFNVYPMPDCTNTQDGEGVFLIEEVSANTLASFKGGKLAFDGAIDEVLESHSNGWWAGINSATGKNEETSKSYQARGLAGSSDMLKTYSVMRYFGKINTEDAIESKIIQKPKKGEKTKPTTEVEVWICGNRVIRAGINNSSLAGRPIHTASFRVTPRSFWGVGLFDVLKDVERLANKALREIVSHSATAFGFFGEIDMTRIGKNQINNSTLLNNFMRVDADYTRGGHTALKMQSLESKIPHIIALIDKYVVIAEDLTAIRRFMSGSADLSSAVRTSGVMNALMTNSSMLIIMVQDYINNTVIAPMVRQYYTLNMLYSSDKSIKGDLQVVIRGSDGIQKKELFNGQVEKMLQYGAAWAANGHIDPRDFKQLIGEWFKVNGNPLTFTISPSEQNALNPQGQVGEGGMPMIDGRSNPQPVAQIPQIQAA
jgi:hypothetical protein